MNRLFTLLVSAITTWFLGGTTPSVLSTETGNSRPLDNFVWFLVDRPENMELIANYEQKTAFRELIVKNNCKKATNGGFYDTNRSPLGLVTVNNIQITKNRPNKLFDGYVWTGDDSVGISRSLPQNPTNAVQTGPMLIENGQPRLLSIVNDSYSRRSVAILTDQDQLIFGMFYDPDSPLDGPTLSELPKLVAQQAGRMDVGIVAAVNLDGGSASAFYDGGFAISEWAPVGSVWCLK